MTTKITTNIGRDADGSIHLDDYCAGATALRRQAIRDGKTLRTACAGLLTLVGALAVVVLIAAAPTPASRGFASVTQTQTPQTW